MNYKIFNELIIPFIIGGTAVSGIKYLSLILGPVYASILGALPIGYLSTYFIHGKDNTKIYLKHYIWAETTFILCGIIYIYLLNNNVDKIFSLVSTTCLILLLNIIRFKIIK